MNRSSLILDILGDKADDDFSLADFSEDRRYAYLSMVASLAWSDGSIDDRERVLLEDIASRLGGNAGAQLDAILDETQNFSIESFNRWVGKITGMKMKVSLMVDLLLTAYADEIYMRSENFYMKYVSGKLGIGYDLYERIFRMVKRYIADEKAARLAAEAAEREKARAAAENRGGGIIQRFFSKDFL